MFLHTSIHREIARQRHSDLLDSAERRQFAKAVRGADRAPIVDRPATPARLVDELVRVLAQRPG